MRDIICKMQTRVVGVLGRSGVSTSKALSILESEEKERRRNSLEILLQWVIQTSRFEY